MRTLLLLSVIVVSMVVASDEDATSLQWSEDGDSCQSVRDALQEEKGHLQKKVAALELELENLKTKLKATTAAPTTQPLVQINMVPYRGRNQETFSFSITGAVDGKVWGSNNLYTDDSALAAAAVHVGLLKGGETKTLRVTVLPGQSSYTGTTANGVTSLNYAQWPGSYKFTDYVPQAPVNMVSFRKRNQETFTFSITGALAGNVWGGSDGVYTDDSALVAAAVHAGLLKVGETKTLRVTVLPGQASYTSSTANGVTTRNYNAWAGSYRFS